MDKISKSVNVISAMIINYLDDAVSSTELNDIIYSELEKQYDNGLNNSKNV